MVSRYTLLCACAFLCLQSAFAQINNDSSKSITDINIDNKIINGLQKQYSDLQSKIDKHSAKVLAKLQRTENRLHAKLNSIDSVKAREVFTGDVQQQYSDLKNNLSQATDKFKRFPLKEYLPGIDSLQTSLSFLTKKTNLPTDKLEQINGLTSKLKDLQTQLQNANDIQAFVKERETVLREQLANLGFVRQLKSINKQVYYYQAQLSESKELLNDKEKLKEKLLETVRTLPAFQKFWQKNSYLAALFPMPSNGGTPQALSGLQARTSVQNAIQQRIGSGGATGVNPQQYFQQQVDAAQAQLSQLKDKLNQFSNGSGSGDMTMPDFKHNEQKTKSFLQRLEYGFNIQSEPTRYSLPTTSDVAFTLGYKLSDDKRLGVGVSYKIGWGNSLKHIRVSSEGIGLRSYIDIKSPVKSKGIFFSGLWLSGGFEYNYLSNFRSLQDLHDNVDIWQRSALLGLSKRYKIGKKEGNMQLLYDFLHNQQTPPGTALKFRVGYTF